MPVIRGLSGFRVRTQENGLGDRRRGLAERRSRRAHRSVAAGQVEVVRGPATLRYGSQAIGGVVNAINNRIPDSIPLNGVRIETRGGVSSADGGRNGAFSTEAGRAISCFTPIPSTAPRTTTHTPHGKQANTSLHSYRQLHRRLLCGQQRVFRRRLFRRSTAPTSFPASKPPPSKNHIKLNQERLSSKGEWRVEDSGIDAIRIWFGVTNYKHNEMDGLPPTETIGSAFKNQQYEGRVEVQHLPHRHRPGRVARRRRCTG